MTGLMILSLKKLYKVMLVTFIIGCTTFYIPGKLFYHPQEMFFQYGSMMVIALSLIVPKSRDLTSYRLFVLIAYVLLNTLLVHFVEYSRYFLINMFIGSILIRDISERVDLNFKTVGNALTVFCAINVIWIALQLANIDPIFQSLNPKNMPQVDICGFMGLKANLGVLAALSLPFIYFSKPINSVICLPLLWYGRSSVAVASVVVTLLIILWFKENKKQFWIVCGLLLAGMAAYLVFYDAPSGEIFKRFRVWGAGINYIAGQNIWFGKGLGSWSGIKFQTLQNNGIPETWLWAHNEYIQFLFELGIAGFVSVFCYLKGLFNRMNLRSQKARKALLILTPILIISTFHFIFHLGRFCGLLCFMLGSVEALLIESKKELPCEN